MTTESLAGWWKRVAPSLRQALGFQPPTLKEADQLMAEAEGVPMSDEEIERIVKGVVREPDAEGPDGGRNDDTD